MVLLLPKALAKQIMCINIRRMEEEGRGVSGKEQGPKGARPKPSLWVEVDGQRNCSLWGWRKALLLSRNKNWNGNQLLALALFSSVQAGANLDSSIQHTSLGCTPSVRQWVSPGEWTVRLALWESTNAWGHGSFCWEQGGAERRGGHSRWTSRGYFRPGLPLQNHPTVLYPLPQSSPLL